MKKIAYRKYLFIAVFLGFLLILPPFFVEGLRSSVLSGLTPLLKLGSFLQKPNNHELKSIRLETENQLLRTELARLRAIIEQNEAIVAYEKTPDHKNSLLFQLKKGIMAQVIYRDPSSWSSSLWIDVGEETNQKIKFPLIQKNSPVLLGKYVVGAIDYVGKKHSRVRLITDSGLKVAVRALRGSVQNGVLCEKIDFLVRACLKEKHLLPKPEETLLIHHLDSLRQKLTFQGENSYLAKGVILGGSEPLWRRQSLLKGIGFNYDFTDEVGPSRDFVNNAKEALIQPHDLLVTTGMDGLFPPGFLVAVVTKLFPLKEGAFSYDIEAMPLAPKLEELTFLYVIAPQGDLS